jgi:hypothetical protein
MLDVVEQFAGTLTTDRVERTAEAVEMTTDRERRGTRTLG